MTDPIADMLVRIKNAQAVKQETVVMPFSKIKQEIARVLKNSQLILDFEKKGRTVAKKLEIKLKYTNGHPAVSNIKRISKSGQRIYASSKAIFSRGPGSLVVVSTSKGIMSGKEARQAKLGGEILCEIS